MNGQNASSEGLSEREKQVLLLIVKGFTNKAIAAELCLSIETVKSHIKALFRKLAVTHRTAAAIKAIQYELISPES